MVVFSIDTSQKIGSVALAREGEVISHREFGAEGSHLVGVGICCEDMLAGAAMAIEDVDRLALVIGPGSFTGLRVGLSFVKGWCAARPVEVVTIGTLDLIAQARLSAAHTVAVMMDARRSEVYAAAFDAIGKELVQRDACPATMFLEKVTHVADGPVIFVGSGARVYSDEINSVFPGAERGAEKDEQPCTKLLAQIGHTLHPIPAGDIGPLEPDYLRASGAVRKKLKPIVPK